MRVSKPQFVVKVVLTVCLVCPTLEVFDTWDPPIQSGNDTEYAIVIAALCLGATYLFVRSVWEFPYGGSVAGRTLSVGLLEPFISTRHLDFGFSDKSPPALALRI